LIDDTFVIDATVHAFNWKPENLRYDWLRELPYGAWRGPTHGMSPESGPYIPTFEEFVESFDYQPEMLRQAMFGESRTDVAIYHGVPMEGMYHDGSSPIWVADQIAKQNPGRCYIYYPLYVWDKDAGDKLERACETMDIIGVKFYPADLWDGEVRLSRLDTDEGLRLVEKAKSLGLKMIGVHKAVSMRVLPDRPFDLGDMPLVFESFPDLTIEIVHGGVAYLDETVEYYRKYANCAINLEGPAGFALRRPEALAAIFEPMIAAGGHERIFYSSAATGAHPAPILDAFYDFEMPEDCAVQVTREMKADMLGRNYARHLGWDIEEMKARIAGDEFGLTREIKEPWSVQRRAAAAREAAE
jgi:uncharacterized protein